MPTAEELIQHFSLEPLPDEGGLYRETYKSARVFENLDEYTDAKPAGTAIYYLLTDEPNSFSALHKLPTDEVYHFYLGDPIEMLLLHPDGTSEHVILGQDVLNGQHVQVVVPAGVWQGSRLVDGGEYGLMGTTMAPGYTLPDYTPGDSDTLIDQYPHEAETIRRLTR